MSSIDTRVVEAQFKNDKFGAGVTGTISMLDKLKSALKLDGAAKGLQDVSAAAGKFDSSAMENGASRIAGSFSAMQATVFGAFASIGAKAVATGAQVLNSFTLAPISAGFDEYELKMGSIQTILANTSRYGTSLQTVNSSLDQLNNYADQTIYNFGDMTKNIGLFTNAGIRVEDATTMIKGFSNAAAASGTSAEGASGAAYQLSQALSAGKITLMDWRSLQNVGMGNKNMQDGIIQLATAMGTFKGTGTDATKATQDFNGSLEKGWLKADVMSNYLKIMSGDMTDAQMAALHLTKAQIDGFKKQASTGLEAATKVRTFTQLMGTLKEAVGSGWTDTFGIILGNFDEATDLFTGISNAVGGFVGRMGTARNTLLQSWKDLGGRAALIDGLKTAFLNVAKPLEAIGAAFRQVFPKSTGQDLVNMTLAFSNFMHDLTPAPETLARLQRTFAGLFAILHIGWTIIKAVATFLFDMFAGVQEGDKGILRFTATLGDFFVGLDKSISSGQGLTKFFATLRDALFKVINPIKDFGQTIGKAMSGVSLGPLGKQIGDFVTKVLSFGSAADSSKSSFEKFTGFLDSLQDKFAKVYHAFGDFFGGIAKIMTNPFSNFNYEDIMKGLQVGSLGAIGLFLAKLTSALKNFNLFGGKSGPGSVFNSLKESLEQVTGTMKAMQNNLNANALLKLAGALAIMAVSIVLLATIDAAGLIRASVAMAVMFAELAGGMKLFSQAVGYGAAAKLNLLAPALILIAVAIGILSLSVKSLAQLSWKDLAKGMSALTVMLGLLVATVKGMSSDTSGMTAAAVSLLLISVAINNLVDAVKSFADMDVKSLGKGLGGVAALLISLALFTKFSSANGAGIAQGAGILLLSMAIGKVVDAVKGMAGLSWENIAKGIVAIGVSLGIMALAMNNIPASSILGAIGALKIAQALSVIADVFIKLQQVSWEELGRGIVAIASSLGVIALSMKAFERINLVKMLAFALVAEAIHILTGALLAMSDLNYDQIAHSLAMLAGTMLILGVALKFMEGSVTGAAALLIVSAALNVLAPVLMLFANMTWGQIAAGLTMLAGVFVVLGVAGYALAPVVPVLIGLGIAIGLLGAAMLLAGAGVLLFATGLSLLAAAGAGATAAIVAIVSGLVGLLPLVAEEIGKALVAFAEVIAHAGPAILGAIDAVLMALLQAIIDVTPKAGEALLTLLFELLSVLEQGIPAIAQAGINILLALLNGIAQNIGKVVDKAADIIVNFLDGISRNLPRIIDSGINLIVSFINGLADGINKHSQEMADAGVKLAKAIVDGMVKGITAGGKAVLDAAKGMAKGALDSVKHFLGIASPSKEFVKVGEFTSEGFAIGLMGNKDKIESAVDTMTGDLKDAMDGANKDIDDSVAKLATLTETRDKDTASINEANHDLQVALKAKKVNQESVHNLQLKIQQLTATRDKDNQAIADEQTALANATTERDKASAAYTYVSQNMTDEKNKLEALADTYDDLTKKIDDANKALDDAKKTRDDYRNSIRDEYDNLPDIGNETKLSDFVTGLQKQIDDTKTFATVIQSLRDEGLNDDLYKNLLSKGTAALPFIQQILQGGQGQVDQLNDLENQLTDVASGLGDSASASLYQAGVDSAQGLVDGLQAQQDAVQAQMQTMADAMVQAVKDKLGIQSPSTVMAEQGDYATQGLVQGLMNASPTVTKAGTDLVAVLIQAVSAAIVQNQPNLNAEGTGMAQAIVDGMVMGINAGSSSIYAAAVAAAGAALTAAKATLGIASPSKEFAKIGQWSSEGMAVGIQNYSSLVSDAASSVGSDAIRTMQKTISGLGDMVSGNVDTTPVIAPVLDLSSVRKDAMQMSSILSASPIAVDAAYSAATSATAGYRQNQAASDELVSTAPVQKSLTLNQYNNSPKALSTAEIYRNTNNQLAKVKGALDD